MTKKIKFLKDYYLSNDSDVRVLTHGWLYKVINETASSYEIKDDRTNELIVCKLGSIYQYEIIEELKVTKYIKITKLTDFLDSYEDGITLNKYYEVIDETEEYYYFYADTGAGLFVPIGDNGYEISEGHPWKHLIKKAAELAEYTMDVGGHFQYKEDGKWVNCADTHYLPNFFLNYEYRLKPRTVKIGNREINAPEWEPLKQGQKYFTPYILASAEDLCSLDVWENRFLDKTMLERGLIYLTRQDAIAAAEAMIELLRGGE